MRASPSDVPIKRTIISGRSRRNYSLTSPLLFKCSTARTMINSSTFDTMARFFCVSAYVCTTIRAITYAHRIAIIYVAVLHAEPTKGCCRTTANRLRHQTVINRIFKSKESSSVELKRPTSGGKCSLCGRRRQ